MAVFITGFGIPGNGRILENFADNSWADIIKICHANKVPDSWVVGDSKLMEINGVNYQIDIIGKNHDNLSDGTGKAPLTFQMHDCYETKFAPNATNSTVGGWGACTMRTTHLPSILAKMPSEVQAGIREVNKLTGGNNGSSAIDTTADKLFLLSEIEIFGYRTNSVAGEGVQYAYYSAGNSRVKTYLGAKSAWGERSPLGTAAYCVVDTNGGVTAWQARDANGVVFAFCF